MINSLFTRLVLVPDTRDPGPSVRLRRYRLARLDLRRHPQGNDDRFGHLKRVYD